MIVDTVERAEKSPEEPQPFRELGLKDAIQKFKTEGA